MKFSAAALVVATSLFGVHAYRQFKVISKLQIHAPLELKTKNGYDHREALFGIPPYGGSIQQQLYYADSDLCDAVVDTRGGFPTREIDDSGQPAPWPSPFLLMVDRGGCTFVTKVRHAQHAGASGVIVADNSCLCEFDYVCKPDSDSRCEDQEPILADDGSGGDITIPSFLMFKQDADTVKEALKGGKFVLMEMAWALPRADKVEYSLWSVPSVPIAQPFEQQFGEVAALLGDKAKFTPHFNIYNGMEAGCARNGENQCLNLCTNKGRYCASDPDHDVTVGVSGADVVTESLRRLCIWNLYGSDGIGMPWWNYVMIFTRQCEQSEDEVFFGSKGCVEDAMEKAGVSWEKVETCMNDSGGLTEDKRNVFLEREIDAKVSLGVVMWPAVFVNGAPIRGAPSFDVVLKAVCAGYSESPGKPQVCEECPNCGSRMGGEYGCVKAGGVCGDAPEPFASSPGKSSSSSGHLVNLLLASSIVVVVLVSVSIAYYLHKRSRTQVRNDAMDIMMEYMPLDEEERRTGPSRS